MKADTPSAAVDGPSLRLQIRITNDPRLLVVVRGAVSELAAALGFANDQCRRITLALDEALSNIIRHAYNNRCDQEIELTCEGRADCLEFTVSDHGNAPDPSKICAQPLDETALGGRGTHLIRQIMDEVAYDREAGVNRLRLKKYIPAPGTKPDQPIRQSDEG